MFIRYLIMIHLIHKLRDHHIFPNIPYSKKINIKRDSYKNNSVEWNKMAIFGLDL